MLSLSLLTQQFVYDSKRVPPGSIMGPRTTHATLSPSSLASRGVLHGCFPLKVKSSLVELGDESSNLQPFQPFLRCIFASGRSLTILAGVAPVCQIQGRNAWTQYPESHSKLFLTFVAYAGSHNRAMDSRACPSVSILSGSNVGYHTMHRGTYRIPCDVTGHPLEYCPS